LPQPAMSRISAHVAVTRREFMSASSPQTARVSSARRTNLPLLPAVYAVQGRTGSATTRYTQSVNDPKASV
jgi:hypothetical protein